MTVGKPVAVTYPRKQNRVATRQDQRDYLLDLNTFDVEYQGAVRWYAYDIGN